VLAEVLELQRLQVVLERLDEPPGRDDLPVLALDQAVIGAEAQGPPGRTSISATVVLLPPPLRIGSGSLHTR